jgi:hypothetical protein
MVRTFFRTVTAARESAHWGLAAYSPTSYQYSR